MSHPNTGWGRHVRALKAFGGGRALESDRSLIVGLQQYLLASECMHGMALTD